MSIKNKIRESLGLETKNVEQSLPSVEYVYEEEEVAEAAPVEQETASDEPRTEEEQMAHAAEQLEKLELGHGSWTLIERALDSLSRNTGAGLTDEDARQRAKELAALVSATDNQLDVLVSAIAQATPVLDRGLAVRNVLYRVLQQCVFHANLDYRLAEGLDAYSDDAVVAQFFERYVSSQYVEEALARVVDDRVLSHEDTREKERHDEVRDEDGFEATRDIQLRYLMERYGADACSLQEAVLGALQDIQLLFDLTAQSYGWDPNQPIPYGFVQEKDGTFTPINDAQTALDAQEIKRAAAQKRRREQRAAQMAKAHEIAAAIVAASLKRPTVHRRK